MRAADLLCLLLLIGCGNESCSVAMSIKDHAPPQPHPLGLSLVCVSACPGPVPQQRGEGGLSTSLLLLVVMTKKGGGGGCRGGVSLSFPGTILCPLPALTNYPPARHEAQQQQQQQVLSTWTWLDPGYHPLPSHCNPLHPARRRITISIPTKTSICF